MRILVNTITTKKYSGGAYQIAYNFVIKTLEHSEIEWIYVISQDLDEILPEEMKKGENYHVFPTQPDFRKSYRRVKREIRALESECRPDIVYSITSPSYFTFKAKEVMRFTNPWVTHPNKYSWSVLSWKDKIRKYLYCMNQRRLIRKAKYFITQTETTKKGIVRITGVPPQNVGVIKNVLPAAFSGQDVTHIDDETGWINVACVGAPVVHKNFEIIPETLIKLKELGINNLRFHVTMPMEEPVWNRMRERLMALNIEKHVVNHGRVSQLQLAEIYRHCNFCFLPTLLEVFSASTLEAMFFDLKIVATDFLFNREVLEDACLYYKPMDAADAARQFLRLINDDVLQLNLSKKMKLRLSSYKSYDKHFNDIVKFLENVTKE